MRSWLSPAFSALSVLFPAALLAAPPVVTTVPADPNNSLVRHDVISGRPTTLKGAVDEACASVCTWSWDPGDGDPAITGNVDANPLSPAELDDLGYNPYWAVWAEHTYTGNTGDAFTATLTVDNGVDAPVSAQYRVEIRPNALSNEVNAAIDEALWHMHRNQFRFLGVPESGAAGGTLLMSRWDYPQYFGQAPASVTGATVNAFEANGYLETGPSTSPYSATVRYGLRYLFARLTTQPMTIQTVGDLSGTGRSDDPDTNGNGVGVFLNGLLGEPDPPYQDGMVMDAIIASGTPAALTTTGPVGILGVTYGEIIQDMADWYSWAQSDSTVHGGWYYNAWDNNAGVQDNSASGWAAIGLVAAQDVFGADVPDFVKLRTANGLEATDNESDLSDIDGQHGYTGTGAIWGPFGVTGAGMVLMNVADVQSTTAAVPDERWIRTENFFRRHFNDSADGNNFKNYYYGMFNFAKAMRTARPQAVVDIGTQVGFAEGGIGRGPSAACVAGGPQPLDWYNDAANGLARTIVDYQILPGDPGTEVFCGAVQPGPCPNIGGFTDRPGNSQGGNQDDFDQPWATQILTRSLFQAGPIAQAVAQPNPTAENVPVTFDPSDSFHQDPAHVIVLYEWDFDDDGVFDDSTPGPTTVQNSFECTPPGNLPCSFPVTLRVTDDNVPALTAEAVVVVDVTVPPHPPTAVSGGPYTVCVDVPTTLDGSASFDINEGTSETGNPPFDTITLYEWDLDLSSGAPFDVIDESGATPLVTFDTEGTLDIALRVTDNTALAFPTAAQPDLTNTESTTLQVVTCPVVDLSLAATADPTTVLIDQSSTLTFTVTNGGPEDSTGAMVTVLIPADVTLGAATPGTGSCTTAGSVVCTLDPIAVGASVDIDIIVTPNAAGDFAFDGTVEPANLDLDDDPTNNDASVTVSALPEAGDVDLAITASADPTNVDVGDDSTVTLVVSNNGPDDAFAAEVTATMPAGLSAESAETDGGTCSISGGDVSCDLDGIAAGDSVEIEIVASATDGGAQTVDANVATNGIDVDSNLENNDDSVTLTIRDVIDIIVNGKGGSGGVGPLELLLLALLAPLFMRLRRQRGLAPGALAIALAVGLSLAGAPRAHAAGNWYMGGSAGSTDAGTGSTEYRDALIKVGIAPRNVSLDDTDTGFKIYGGYSFNEHFGLEAGYTDLGEIVSSFATTVAPGDVNDVLRTARGVHPYMAAGATFALVGKVPVSDRIEIFGKFGAFVWDNTEVHLEVVSGATGETTLDRDGSDAFYGAGVAFALGDGWHVRGEWERYQVDDQDVDFISFGVEKRIPRQP